MARGTRLRPRPGVCPNPIRSRLASLRPLRQFSDVGIIRQRSTARKGTGITRSLSVWAHRPHENGASIAPAPSSRLAPLAQAARSFVVAGETGPNIARCNSAPD